MNFEYFILHIFTIFTKFQKCEFSPFFGTGSVVEYKYLLVVVLGGVCKMDTFKLMPMNEIPYLQKYKVW